jgi:hypothetical protein
VDDETVRRQETVARLDDPRLVLRLYRGEITMVDS